MENALVLIVGAGPSGLAMAGCLTQHSIPYVILEREDCYASLWKKRTYDRLGLHLAKEFCFLPHRTLPPDAPTFMPKDYFLRYVDGYVSEFKINPRYHRSVQSAFFDEVGKKWRIEAKNTLEGSMEVYSADFLVVATGENSEGFIPSLHGLDGFPGDILHSNHYKSGSKYKSKDVLVVGCGNSGMEIAYDLFDHGARTSIVIRSPFHVLTKELVHRGMCLLKYLPFCMVDAIITMLARLEYGDLTKYGIRRPRRGPFAHKTATGRSPVIDVGTIKKIQDGEIEVVSDIFSINKNNVVFKNGTEKKFDAIVFATGYRSAANKWLKDYKYGLNGEGMPKNSFPGHWKGEKGLYCAGLSRRGLLGVSMDAQAIANDINKVINGKK
ncbi:probable indole-3-pyruvate monooxygenase YUCCA10 [Alnus glutinosa]|uniref:probable indole-3-pyruvate monooxygenase YUCCA10 n=1 Tax=Alnus glutinosa TaxID=3517 RepID=UPI002D775CEB|nr:probable indole-3-pyruvate monooxygenase YUCCA10 [Alnus glutinosa]